MSMGPCGSFRDSKKGTLGAPMIPKHSNQSSSPPHNFPLLWFQLVCQSSPACRKQHSSCHHTFANQGTSRIQTLHDPHMPTSFAEDHHYWDSLLWCRFQPRLSLDLKKPIPILFFFIIKTLSETNWLNMPKSPWPHHTLDVHECAWGNPLQKGLPFRQPMNRNCCCWSCLNCQGECVLPAIRYEHICTCTPGDPKKRDQ